MPSRSTNLLASEYNGFRFLWESEDESGGRKLIIHEHPNSNAVTIQDMGGIPQTFTVNAIVGGSNYLADSEKFRNILVEGGEGELVLPNFGIHKVRLESYTRRTSQKQIGKIDFTLTFKLMEMTGLKGEQFVTQQDVYNGYLEANDALADALLDAWEKPSTNANRKSAISDTKSFIDSAKEVAKTVNDAVRQAEKLAGMVEEAVMTAELYAKLMVEEGVLAALASAVGVGSSYQKVVDMIDWGKNLPNRLVQLVEVFGGVDFTDTKDWNIPLWEELTPEREERNSNRRATVDTARANAMIFLLNDVVEIDFDTSSEIQIIQNQLQEFFEALTTQEDSDIFTNQDFMEKLLALKESSFGYLEQTQSELFYTATVNVSTMPANVLAQAIYGEESRAEIERMAEIIKSLNDGRQFFDGETTVLEKQG